MVREHKKNPLLLVITVVVILLLSVVVPGAVTAEEGEEEENDTNDYIVREPIRINGNDDFAAQAAAEGWSGDGSEGDPYVIEGYEINGTGYGYGIYVGNTTVHFVVRGCYVHNASIAVGELHSNIYKYYADSGMNLYNVQNGRLESNTIQNNRRKGIRLYRSNHNYIANNKISNDNISRTASGISLFVSSNNIIVNNSISRQHTGIEIINSHLTPVNNTVNNNTFSENFGEDYVEVEIVNGQVPSIISIFTAVAIFAVVITVIVIKKRKSKRGE